MEIIKIDTETEFEEDSFVGLGNFDGVHLGHRVLLKTLVDNARNHNKKASVLIFKEHTKNTINNKQQFLLTSIEERYDILRELGIDYVFEMDFNREVMNIEPEAFISDLLVKNLHARGIVVGFDYRFGHKAKGDTNLLRELAEELDIHLDIIDPVYYKGVIISSTIIRKLIFEGKLKEASTLLGKNFIIGGTVVHGKNLGTKMGYPTANIQPDSNYITPAFGVYDTNIYVKNKVYKAATSVGTNPTLEEENIKIEAHILDFDEMIYGESVKLEFLEYLRKEIAFDSVEELFKQIEKDTEDVRSRKI